ncbi:DUF1822 family protein [Fortiea contorta]|uniref:DUF1822 family protein n=1 Tax=Fortiea contorta TaxID=1892405 RepID=UPI00034DE19A|nr:DUF1822 family protein [Fortiea contorta]
MTDRLNALRELAIPFLVTASFRRQARAYAAQYFTPDTQQRVYFNSLAVLVADGYFRLLGFETNVTQPERWNAAYRLWSEANELELTGLGYLECCVITTEHEAVILPSVTQSRYLGYLFVEIANSEQAATLFGFLPASETTDAEIAIADLQSMDDLIDYLALTQEFAQKKITYLRNWLNNIYAADWEPSMRDLKTATCKKKLELAGKVLEMQLSVSESNEELIFVRVNVKSESGALPVGMQVSVPDESDIYTETVIESADLISIPLELTSGEEFWVALQIGEIVLREYFIT